MNSWKAVCAALLFVTSIAFANAMVQEASGDVREVQMTAKKYEFSPNSIHVKKGEHVKLVITATDRDHGIKIEAFHIEQKLKKGEPTTIEFTPDKAGSFPFKCSVVCGFGHRGMKGMLIVEE